MENSRPNANVSAHPSSRTSESVVRLAASIDPVTLHEDRLRLLEVTKSQFERLRRECLELAYIMESHSPETVSQMMDGLDVFVESFVKLVERIGIKPAATTEGDVSHSQTSMA
ncbi:hypothetical protein [Asticcacaulis endophyticus]|uniref:Uncharacterized protein n=1 Tax=Asticcacaulis endophyticus TaxID=1395890 RepID=A0A918USZ6_9CAUL|nr:hypothetical protein [Asticcacaulis endophyticus]GGZ32830.1 hypothetical protein GCM10011273_18870 [Asticcacaulis endophyticus]